MARMPSVTDIKRIMRFCLYLLLALSVLLPVSALAAETGKKTVRVGWFESAFNTTDQFGRRSGYSYEYQQKIAAYTGWSYEYVTGSWSDLMVMLQHDPSAWRRSILGECHAQLTLSGHTHGMQFGIFGWSPLALKEEEWGGFVYEGSRALFVTTGVGGLIPFRLGMPGEIVVVTLKKRAER